MTIPKLIDLLAAACGIHAATLNRYFAELREARLIRVSGKGGGKAAVNLKHWECATVIAALCALGPGGVVDAVATFTKLRRVNFNERAANEGRVVGNEGLSVDPATGNFLVGLWHGPLMSDLANWIVWFAYEIRDYPDGKSPQLDWMRTWQLAACLDSATASITYTDAAGEKVVQEYSDPQSELLEPNQPPRRRGIRRMTLVDASAMEVFALVFLDFVKTEAKYATDHASELKSFFDLLRDGKSIEVALQQTKLELPR